jgi:hypothetical protein
MEMMIDYLQIERGSFDRPNSTFLILARPGE